MKAIIFGAGGQDGYYLKKILEREGITVHAFTRKDCDVGVQGYVAVKIAEIKPDYIFHLAATSSTKHDCLRENQYAIVDGSTFILDAVYAYCPSCKVFLSGSILQFMQHAPVNHLLSVPSYDSVYAAQRHAAVAMGRYYRTLGVQVYIGYFSHHDSPRRPGCYLAKRIAEQAVAVAKGEAEHLTLQDPYDLKEWNFAGDMMEAVWEMVNQPVFEAVLGSGEVYSLMHYATHCLSVALNNDLVIPRILYTTSRDITTISVTNDRKFRHHFKTGLKELARMMVTASADARTEPLPAPRTDTSFPSPCRLQ